MSLSATESRHFACMEQPLGAHESKIFRTSNKNKQL